MFADDRGCTRHNYSISNGETFAHTHEVQREECGVISAQYERACNLCIMAMYALNAVLIQSSIGTKKPKTKAQ